MDNFKNKEIITVKLSDIKIQRMLTFTKNKKKVDSYQSERLQCLERLWHSLDIKDAENYVESNLPPRKNPLHPQWWNHYNYKKYHKRGNGKAKKYLKIVESLVVHGYKPDDYKSGYIKADKYLRLIDGNHRFDLLFAKYGESHEVQIMVCGWGTHVFAVSFQFMIMVGFWMLFTVLTLMKISFVICMIPLWIGGFIVCNVLKLFGVTVCSKSGFRFGDSKQTKTNNGEFTDEK